MNGWALSRRILPIFSNILSRSIHTSSVCCRIQAGRVRGSKMRNKPISYEVAFKPDDIQHKKGWLSFNTGNLHGEKNAHQMAYEDMFIRQFMVGTFYRLLKSEIVIKRRLNILDISMFVSPMIRPEKCHFLKSYSEEFLGRLLQYNVKLNLLVASDDDMIYKYV